MDFMKMFALVFLASIAIAPFASASYCSSPTTMAYNATYNFSGTLYPYEKTVPCPNGCDIARGICTQGFYATPLPIYMFFEGLAFLLFFVGIIMGARVKKKDDEESPQTPLFIPLMACMLFFILAYLGGVIMVDGEMVTSIESIWINFAFGMMSIAIVFYELMAKTGKQLDEYRRK
jgi:hypothetical protein